MALEWELLLSLFEGALERPLEERAAFLDERTKGDALSKRFEEALKQAKEEPLTKPTRDFDLD